MISEPHGWGPVLLEVHDRLRRGVERVWYLSSAEDCWQSAKLANIRPLVLENLTAEKALTAAKR